MIVKKLMTALFGLSGQVNPPYYTPDFLIMQDGVKGKAVQKLFFQNVT